MNNVLDQKLNELHEKLRKHPLYGNINSVNQLKLFMECHVFAVWDFMSLLKSLQGKITCTSVPWRPSPYSKDLVRFINEIVLGEESDIGVDGRACDHFTMYLRAMDEVGADTKKIEKFIDDYNLGDLPPAVRSFVSFNLDLSLSGKIHEIAAVFFYGREKLIPDMFQSIIDLFEEKKLDCPHLSYYFKRHIELDGDEHSGLAKKCLEALCKGDKSKLEEAKLAGIKSLELRYSLWNEVLKSIYKDNSIVF